MKVRLVKRDQIEQQVEVDHEVVEVKKASGKGKDGNKGKDGPMVMKVFLVKMVQW